MTMKLHSAAGGLIMVVLSLLGGGWLAYFLWTALVNGFAPGKLGAVHYAWSIRYTVSIFGCVIGIGLSIALIVMGLRFAGLFGNEKDQSGHDKKRRRY